MAEGVFGVPWPLQFPSPLLGLALLLLVVGGEVPPSSLRRGVLEISLFINEAKAFYCSPLLPPFPLQ